MKVYRNLFLEIIDPENLFLAWHAFRRGKQSRHDVLKFEAELESHIFQLHRDLSTKVYVHSGYAEFYIDDPKRRHIHKATVRDRVLHHAVFNIVNTVYEPSFIENSFSCRIDKGVHKGVSVVEQMIRKVSRNGTEPCYVLKCDVQKFFDSIDHTVLLSILKKKIKDVDALWLLEEIITSFESGYRDLFSPIGVPIGNLTSQLFANVYMNELDQYMKHTLRVTHYARYTDDFVVVSRERMYLQNLIAPIEHFLQDTLKLRLHPNKIEIFKYSRGVDFLGTVIFPHHKLIRKRTWLRLVRKLKEKLSQYRDELITKQSLDTSLQSNLAVLSHTNSHRKSEAIQHMYWYLLHR